MNKLVFKEWVAFWVAFHRSKIRSTKESLGYLEELRSSVLLIYREVKIRDELGEVERDGKTRRPS